MGTAVHFILAGERLDVEVSANVLFADSVRTFDSGEDQPEPNPVTCGTLTTWSAISSQKSTHLKISHCSRCAGSARKRRAAPMRDAAAASSAVRITPKPCGAGAPIADARSCRSPGLRGARRLLPSPLFAPESPCIANGAGSPSRLRLVRCVCHAEALWLCIRTGTGRTRSFGHVGGVGTSSSTARQNAASPRRPSATSALCANGSSRNGGLRLPLLPVSRARSVPNSTLQLAAGRSVSFSHQRAHSTRFSSFRHIGEAKPPKLVSLCSSLGNATAMLTA